MKKLFTYVIMLYASLSVSVAQQIQYPEPVLNPESCTSIMVGKKASADGSVMTSHTCDSNYRTWMDIVPSASYDHDTTTTVYTGRMHTEYAEGTRGMIAKGTLPEARSTYQFLNTAYPCLNEKQLGIGETTITGRKALVNKKGMFMIEELQRIALQRCTTARDAIRLMGELIEKYGYGDWGECLTIADPKEVWHFEVFGEGPDKIGGVWAAIRIPDDHVGVSANIPRISKVDPSDKENCMASANVFEVAKRMGFWDGKKPFRFWEAYGGGNYSGELKSFSIREFFILNKLAPSLHLSYDAEELPISVKPEKPDAVKRYRLVAVPQCSYSTVIQLRDWLPDAVGGVVWMAYDNPGQSPRIPIFCGTKDLPACFKVCGQHRYREDAAVWAFRRANKLATVRWGATKDRMKASIAHFTEKGQTELPFVESRYKEILTQQGEEAAKEYLTGYTADFAGATMLRWREMGDSFWTQFERGF